MCLQLALLSIHNSKRGSRVHHVMAPKIEKMLSSGDYEFYVQTRIGENAQNLSDACTAES